MAWGSLNDLIAKFAPLALLDSHEVDVAGSAGDDVAQAGHPVNDRPYCRSG